MVRAARLTVLLLTPVCLAGRLPERAGGGDLFLPLLRLPADEPEAQQPVPALADMPLPGVAWVHDDSGAPAGGGRPIRAFQQPAAFGVSPNVRTQPDFQFEHGAFDPSGEALPMGREARWEGSNWLPGRPGLFARQPLRQRLRLARAPPQGRHRGVGRPLINESWQYRPFSAGWFIGGMFGSPLIDDWLGISSGYFTGLRFGWDQNHYWGLEMQFGYGEMGLWDSARAQTDWRDWYRDQHEDVTDAELDRLVNAPRDLALYQWAVSAMYYPWGDARWRPYFSVGVGAARMTFTDIFLVHYDKTFFVLPLAVGVKYHWNDWLALRVEGSNSFSVPGGGRLMAVHNVSINGALEIRFGGRRTAYWPWNPTRTYW